MCTYMLSIYKVMRGKLDQYFQLKLNLILQLIGERKVLFLYHKLVQYYCS